MTSFEQPRSKMRVHLSRVEIQNFRNFQHIDLALSPSTVIVGENKVGKSNFIDALRLVLDPSLPDTARQLKAEDFWDGLKQPFGGNVVEVVTEVSGLEDDKDAKAVLLDCIVQTNPLVARLTYRFRPRQGIAEKTAREADYEYVIFGGVDEKNRVTHVRQWISLMVLPALRDAEGELQHWRRSPLRPLLERLKLDPARLKAIAGSLDQVTKQLIAEKPLAVLAEEITRRIDEMIGRKHAVDARLGLAPTEAENLVRAIRIFIDGDKFRPISNASLGSANVLYLALLMQELEAKKGAGEKVSTMLAIEEPEAHLHPHVQRLVFRYFLARDYPLIVTTHSPNIASVAPIRSLAVLHTTTKGSEARSARELSFSEQETADLQRYLDVTRAEIVFAKGVVLVEGPAEQFLIPAFAQSLKDPSGKPIDLDRFGVSVCSVYGTDFRPYVRLLGDAGLRIPFAVVTDGDARTVDGVLVSDGIKRGGRLLRDEDRPSFDELTREGKLDKARNLLSRRGIFVGLDTLEIDLLENYSSQIIETYNELVSVEKARNGFAKAVTTAYKGDREAGSGVIAAIERRGKGRFSQRLAGKLAGSEPPPYIKAALQYVLRLVEGQDDAGTIQRVQPAKSRAKDGYPAS